jgi:hypothetical protein
VAGAAFFQHRAFGGDVNPVAAGDLVKAKDLNVYTKTHLPDNHPTGQAGLVVSPNCRGRFPAKAAAKRAKCI